MSDQMDRGRDAAIEDVLEIERAHCRRHDEKEEDAEMQRISGSAGLAG
jgi:hypothetical protein